MDIHREGKFFIGSDLQGRALVGIDSRRIAECIGEAKRRAAFGVFGHPTLGFHDDNLDFLTDLTDIGYVWFWDIKLKSIDGLYATTNLRHFGVHPKRPPIDFSKLSKLKEVVWFHNAKDKGMKSLKHIRSLHVWRFKPKDQSYEGLDVPERIEEFEIYWANPKTLKGLPLLPRVKRLRISCCRNLETIAELPRIAPNVEHLVVASCGRVADGPEVVRKLPKLRHAFVRDKVLVTK